MATPHVRSFTFNSALTKLEPETGAFNEAKFRDMIKPLRGRLMSKDGMDDCEISRYSVNIFFIATVISSEAVEKHVLECLHWAQKVKGLFPFLTEQKKDVALT